jgi:hypothetical protein
LSAAPAKDLLSKPAIRESRPTVRHRPSTDSSSYPVGRITRKRRAVRVYWGDRNFPLASLDYHSTNPRPRPARLGRNERIENHACFARVDARPSVLGRQDNCITVHATGSCRTPARLSRSTNENSGSQVELFSPRGWDIRIPRLGVVIRDASRPHAVARQKHTRRLRQVRALKTSDTVSFA